VTIDTDGWIKLDTKQLDKVAKFDSSARNFHSTRGVHIVKHAPAYRIFDTAEQYNMHVKAYILAKISYKLFHAF